MARAAGNDSSEHELIDELADEFLSRKLAGELPTISEYCQRYPDLQEQIRELFPTLDLLEKVKPEISPSVPRTSDHPETISDYRIVRQIGQGGMGVVYEAEHRSLGRRVALKVVSSRLSSDAQTRARFEREGRAVAKLHHTNIVPLFEVGDDDGHLFLAMQLIHGKSLDHVISELRDSNSDVWAKCSGPDSQRR